MQYITKNEHCRRCRAPLFPEKKAEEEAAALVAAEVVKEEGEVHVTATDTRQICEAIGFVLRALRANSGLSQHDVADRGGIERSHLCRWESGHRTPNIESLKKLCKIYGMDLATFVAVVELSMGTYGDSL
jgi:ribosome-binding protein aMBF1 (putative translation factor)